MSNTHLHFAKKLKDDEYYTRRFLADLIFDKTVEVFGTKKVLYVLAADGDHSFFTKYAQSHQLHYVNNIDIYDVSYFIFKKYWTTVVITNPPFSKLTDWLKKVQDNVQDGNLQLCLIVPITFSTVSLTWYMQHCYFYQFNSRMSTFFHNFELKGVPTMLMTTFPIKDWPVQCKQPPAPIGDTFTTSVRRLLDKPYYESGGYHLVGVAPKHDHVFKRLLWQKNKNNPE